VLDANEKILDVMRKKNTLLESEEITHSYPHCWRCKKPVIFRATPQWFIAIDKDNLREKLLEEIKQVEWTPPEGENRISAMVEGRPDWCISRQRYWGVPIPVFYCAQCGEHLLAAKLIRKLAALVRAEGSDILLKENLPVEMTCGKCGGKKFRLENDILDVWFDSGASSHILEETATSTGAGSSHLSYWPARQKTERLTEMSSPTVLWWTAKGAKCPNHRET